MKIQHFLFFLFFFFYLNGFSQWNTLYYPVSNYDSIANIEKLSFLNVDRGVAACSNTYSGGSINNFAGSIIMTSDGGVNWSTVFSLDSVAFTEIVYLDSVNIIATGTIMDPVFNSCKGVVARSTDNGLSWDTTSSFNKPFYPPSLPSFHQLKKVNNNVLIANSVECVHPAEGGVLISKDKGLSWEFLVWPVSLGYYGIDLEFYTDSMGLLADYRNILLRTSDQGKSFDTITVDSNLSLFVRDISNRNNKTVNQYLLAEVVNQSGLLSIYKSKDKGLSWSKVSDIYNGNVFQWLEFVNDTIVYLMGPNNIVKSVNGGINWQSQSTSSPAIGNLIGDVNDMISLSADTLFMGGNRQFYRTYTGGDSSLLTTIKENTYLPTYSIYPNPAKGQIQLAFEVKKGEQFSFKLYNLQGQQLQQISLQTGKEHSIPLKNLPAGLYIYRLQNREGKLVSGKLMVE